MCLNWQSVNWRISIFVLCIFAMVGCQGDPPTDQPHQLGKWVPAKPNQESANEYFPPAAYDYFWQIDGKAKNGKYAPLSASPYSKNIAYDSDDESYSSDESNKTKDDKKTSELTEIDDEELNELEIKGRNAWMLWTGGNELFWDWLSKNGYGSVDFLKLVDSEQRSNQFERAGLIIEPGMRPPTEEETKVRHGVRFDVPEDPAAKRPDEKVYGESTGILGMRIFKNPNFENSPAAQRAWASNQPAQGEHRFYTDDEYAADPRTIKPYVVGISCAICHVSYHPLNSPVEGEKIKWENISSTVGSQYLRVREVFGNTLEPDSYLYHVMDSQLPGTIDTSLIPTDHVNNANTMNAIFGLGSRIERSLYNPKEILSRESAQYSGLWDESIEYGAGEDKASYPPAFEPFKSEFEGSPDRRVPRVLLDGSDSIGTWVALARVYLNIGTYHQQWVRTHNPVLGFKEQTPLTLADCEANSTYWHATKLRVDAMTAYFLKSTDPMLLKDAIVNNDPVEKFQLTEAAEQAVEDAEKDDPKYKFSGEPDDAALAAGRKAFAKGCIVCHSSKQPDYKNWQGKQPVGLAHTLELNDLWRLTRGDGELPADYQKWANEVVERSDFWEGNYLSTDMRIPVTMTQTNSARAMATNAKTGHVWEDFASNTFKDLPSVGKIKYRDPTTAATNSFDAPAGGPGYYRVPSLVSAWATAPFLHNNSVGLFNNDPSIKGRLAAYDDAIAKLLSPGKRLAGHDLGKLSESKFRSDEDLTTDGGLIWKTSQRSYFKIAYHQVPSFIAGRTGYSKTTLKILPWVPSIVFTFLGLYFFLRHRIASRSESWWSSNEQIQTAVKLTRLIGILVAAAVGAVLSYLLWHYFSAIRMVEVGSGWSVPWVTLQILILILLAFLLAVFMVFRYRLFAKLLGGAFLIAALLFALAFGTFASGAGGDLKVGPFPEGMPVNLIVNIDPHASLGDLRDVADALIAHFKKYPEGEIPDENELSDFNANVTPLLLQVSNCPDLVLDRGHDYEFMQQLSEEEKQNLALLIKTF